MIVMIHGPDASLARAEAAKRLAALDPDGFNTTMLDGREVSLTAVIAAVGSVGFFAAPRVVVVENLLARSTRGAGGPLAVDDAQLTAGGLDLAPLLGAVPDQNVLMLVDPELASIPASVKRLAPPDATIVSSAPPRGRQLVDWVAAAAREGGGDIDRRAAQLLVELLYPQTWSAAPSNPRYDRPPDTRLLQNEIERLLLYAHPDPIRESHIRELIETGPNDRVFRFIDAAVAGQLDVATAELERLLLAGEEPAKLIAQVQQQVELAVLVAAAPGKPPNEIGRALALTNPNRMSGVAASVRGRSERSLIAAVDHATDVDRKLKTGHLRQPADALYHLLAKLARTVEPAHTRAGH
ncbi:MAG: hypothetical protein M3464_01865 [Chloroflexota bacterium]|nr:hypothetical protein [Chloroflexota bacterium]